jgi:hypothetical protein
MVRAQKLLKSEKADTDFARSSVSISVTILSNLPLQIHKDAVEIYFSVVEK